MIELITTHKQEAKERLAQQYKDSTKFISFLDALNDQVQDLEETLHSLIDGRWIDSASGQVLDDFGTIVGQERLGFDDTFYRVLLLVKIGQNISEGDPERVIDIYKIITRATQCYLDEYFPGGIYLMSNGEINPITAQFIYEKLQDVVAAGVRIDYIGEYDENYPFAFDGFPNAAPFDDGSDAATAGIFAFTYDTAKPFSFEDGSDSTDGFGTSDDHIVGGRFQTS